MTELYDPHHPPPSTGAEWEPNGRAADVLVEPEDLPNPLEAPAAPHNGGNGHAPETPIELVPYRDALTLFVAAMFKNARRDGYVSFRC